MKYCIDKVCTGLARKKESITQPLCSEGTESAAVACYVRFLSFPVNQNQIMQKRKIQIATKKEDVTPFQMEFRMRVRRATCCPPMVCSQI